MVALEALLADVEDLEWGVGNTAKNVLGHEVSQSEAEKLFFVAPLVRLEDEKHSTMEQRYLIFGPTGAGRLLTAAFTLRQHRIRIVSVRDMSRQERRRYAHAD